MFNQNNSAINFTNATVQLPRSDFCRRFQEEEFRMPIYLATIIFIILNILSCPVIILMNSLVILAVKTRQRKVQSNYNILLACLAGTDLLVGTVTQPTFIAAEVFVIAGGPVATYCNIKNNFGTMIINFSVVASLLHLVSISVERYAAMKYALRYNEIVTKQRLAVAVILSWFLAGVHPLFKLLNTSSLPNIFRNSLVIFSISAIVYCHISVYLATRRHEKQIKTEQISEEATAKFLKEKKAWKTTSVIIGFVFLSYLPAVLYNFKFAYKELDHQTRYMRYILRPVVDFSLILNSLCNPIIYCWRSKKIRNVMIALVRRQNPS